MLLSALCCTDGHLAVSGYSVFPKSQPPSTLDSTRRIPSAPPHLSIHGSLDIPEDSDCMLHLSINPCLKALPWGPALPCGPLTIDRSPASWLGPCMYCRSWITHLRTLHQHQGSSVARFALHCRPVLDGCKDALHSTSLPAVHGWSPGATVGRFPLYKCRRWNEFLWRSLPTFLPPSLGSIFRLPPPCAIQKAVGDFADLVQPEVWHRLPPPCVRQKGSGLDGAELGQPGEVFPCTTKRFSSQKMP